MYKNIETNDNKSNQIIDRLIETSQIKDQSETYSDILKYRQCAIRITENIYNNYYKDRN